MRVIRGLLQQKRISSHSLAGVDFASQASQTPKTRSFACCQKSPLLCLWSALGIPALLLVFRCATGCRVEQSQARPSGCSVWQHVYMQVRILSISFANVCVLKRSLFSRLGRVTDMHGPYGSRRDRVVLEAWALFLCRRSSSLPLGDNRSQSRFYWTAACSSRQLLQAGPGETTTFPGCTFLSDSEVATNPDFSTLYYELQYTGLNNTLANLQSVVTLFAPTNEAFQQYVAAYNETAAQAMTEPLRGGEAAAFLVDDLELHIAAEALPVLCWTPHCPNLASYCSFECIRLPVIMIMAGIFHCLKHPDQYV